MNNNPPEIPASDSNTLPDDAAQRTFRCGTLLFLLEESEGKAAALEQEQLWLYEPGQTDLGEPMFSGIEPTLPNGAYTFGDGQETTTLQVSGRRRALPPPNLDLFSPAASPVYFSKGDYNPAPIPEVFDKLNDNEPARELQRSLDANGYNFRITPYDLRHSAVSAPGVAGQGGSIGARAVVAKRIPEINRGR